MENNPLAKIARFTRRVRLKDLAGFISYVLILLTYFPKQGISLLVVVLGVSGLLVVASAFAIFGVFFARGLGRTVAGICLIYLVVAAWTIVSIAAELKQSENHLPKDWPSKKYIRPNVTTATADALRPF